MKRPAFGIGTLTFGLSALVSLLLMLSGISIFGTLLISAIGSGICSLVSVWRLTMPNMNTKSLGLLVLTRDVLAGTALWSASALSLNII